MSIYLVTQRVEGRDLLRIAAEALQAGVTAIQLRDKALPDREIYALGRALGQMTKAHGASFLVNDRADLCLALDADGVHLGQGDLPVPVARKILGPGKIIGLSVDNAAEAIAGEKAGADYLGAGPLYPTATKADAGPVMGLPGLEAICRAVSCPVVAIGGIGPGRAAQALHAGAAGVALASAVCSAPRPGETVRALRGELNKALAKR